MKIVLLGPPGSGKTHRFLAAFKKQLAAQSPGQIGSYFIVPSAEHRQRIMTLLLDREMPGFFDERVTTLSRLIEEHFKVTEPPAASNLTRQYLLYQSLQEPEGSYFDGVKEKKGFLSAALSLIGELKECRITPEDFRLGLSKLKKLEPVWQMKYESLAALYERYQNKIYDHGFRDPQDLLEFYIKAHPELPGPSFETLWIDGFFDFSELQFNYLDILSKLSENVYMSLTLGTGQESFFPLACETLKRLENLGFKITRADEQNYRTTVKDLSYLQHNLFRKSNRPIYQEPVSAVHLLEGANAENEIELIGREILTLKKNTSVRFSDAVILLRSLGAYQKIIQSVFRRLGIPFEIHERTRLKNSSWMNVLCGLIRIFSEGWQKEDLLSFLKCGFAEGFVASVGRGALRELERYASVYAVAEGREKWFDEPEKNENKEYPEKNKILEPLFQLESDLRSAPHIDKAAEIFRQAVRNKFFLVEMSDDYNALERHQAAVVSRFESLLDEITRAFRRENKTYSFERFAEDFLRLSELDLYSLSEKNPDCVQVYDVSLARQKEYKIVFLAGLLEGQFPLEIREDIFLSDWERRLLAGFTKYPLPQKLPRESLERYLFLLALTRASEKVYLSYPRMTDDAKPTLPSFYLEEVKALFAREIPKTHRLLSKPYPNRNQALNHRDRELYAAGSLFDEWNPLDEPDLLPEDIFRRLVCSDQSRRKMLALFEEQRTGLRSKALLKQTPLLPAEPSPTRLETYGKCSFLYFADKALKLYDPEEDTIRREQGSAMHKILEKFFSGPHLKKMQPEELSAWIDSEINSLFHENRIRTAYEYQKKIIRSETRFLLLRFIEAEIERLRESIWKPLHLEYGFGSDEGAFEIDLMGRRQRFQGRVDRIDVDQDARHMIIIDYKRSVSFKKKDLNAGLALQLPVYILAAEKKLGLEAAGAEFHSIREIKASGFYRKDLKDLSGRSSRNYLTEPEWQEMLHRSLWFAERFLKALASSQIEVRPRDCLEGCRFASVCRIEKWRLPQIQDEIRAEDEAAYQKDRK